jgi:hypothetical protein
MKNWFTMRVMLMILAITGLLFTSSPLPIGPVVPTAKAMDCVANVDGWGAAIPGEAVAVGLIALRPIECAYDYQSRIELWIHGDIPTPRTCISGSYWDSGRNSCVDMAFGDAKAEEVVYRYGIFDAHARGFLIAWPSGEWGPATDFPFGGIDSGDEPDPTDDYCNIEGNPDCPPTPILVPLTNSQQHKLTSKADGVLFDLDADGTPEQTSWTTADAKLAFLAIDRNGDGFITSGKELFGDNTVPGAKNGFRALSMLNIEMGGVKKGAISDGDPLYSKLLLWEDANHNGISEPGELQPASNVLTAMGLSYEVIRRRDGHGNLLRYKGWAELRTKGPGQKRSTDPVDHRSRLRNVYDVIFAAK